MVPATALGFAGVDLEAARRSPVFTAAIARLLGAVDLDPAAPELRGARGLVIAGVPGLPSTRTLPGGAAFTDPYAAAQLAVSFGMLKKLVATEVPAAEKLSLTPMGAAVWFRATLTEAELAALLARR